jgi:hypothetical protein
MVRVLRGEATARPASVSLRRPIRSASGARHSAPNAMPARPLLSRTPTCDGDRPPFAGDRRPDEGRQQEIEPVDRVHHQAPCDRLDLDTTHRCGLDLLEDAHRNLPSSRRLAQARTFGPVGDRLGLGYSRMYGTLTLHGEDADHPSSAPARPVGCRTTVADAAAVAVAHATFACSGRTRRGTVCVDVLVRLLRTRQSSPTSLR